LHTAFIGLVWLRTRTNIDRSVQSVILASCVLYTLLPSLLKYFPLIPIPFL
jgi:hypothetical protein